MPLQLQRKHTISTVWWKPSSRPPANRENAGPGRWEIQGGERRLKAIDGFPADDLPVFKQDIAGDGRAAAQGHRDAYPGAYAGILLRPGPGTSPCRSACKSTVPYSSRSSCPPFSVRVPPMPAEPPWETFLFPAPRAPLWPDAPSGAVHKPAYSSQCGRTVQGSRLPAARGRKEEERKKNRFSSSRK